MQVQGFALSFKSKFEKFMCCCSFFQVFQPFMSGVKNTLNLLAASQVRSTMTVEEKDVDTHI